MTDLTRDLASRIESLAIDLAQLAGTEITAALGRDVAVRYKGVGADQMVTDPVSEVDAQVEDFIRDRVGKEFPDHGIVGEEIDTPPDPDKDIVWAIDPIDGTANFVNGFPLFCGIDRCLASGPADSRCGLVLDQPPASSRRLSCQDRRGVAVRV